MRKILILIVAFLLVAANLYAGNGDLIVDENLGVGTTNPQAKLHVGDGSLVNSGVIRLDGTGSPSSPSTYYTELRNSGESFLIDNSMTTSPDFFIDANGYVGIGTTSPGYKLHVAAGDFNVDGVVRTFGNDIMSDIKFKKDIEPIESALSKVTKLKGVSFSWKNEELQRRRFTQGKHYGVIAQEIETVLPEIVKENREGDKAVAYTEIIPLLIEAIKEQQEKITALEGEQQVIKNQQAMISALFEKVNALERQVQMKGTVVLSDY